MEFFWTRKSVSCKRCVLRGSIKKYKMTIDKYDLMLEEQNNRCAICYCQFCKLEKPHVDHNHKTGAVRALLCRHCNTAIGSLKENMSIVVNVLVFLQKHNGSELGNASIFELEKLINSSRSKNLEEELADLPIQFEKAKIDTDEGTACQSGSSSGIL